MEEWFFHIFGGVSCVKRTTNTRNIMRIICKQNEYLIM